LKPEPIQIIIVRVEKPTLERKEKIMFNFGKKKEDEYLQEALTMPKRP
jgi:hypothetical protein